MHAVEGIMGRFAPAIPIHVNEFIESDTWFDYNRYTKPFINEEVIANLFNNETNKVNEFLNDLGNGTYELLPAFNTQRKIEDYFLKLDNANNLNIKQGLFDLISNVNSF